ncbi:hypothetical protein COOONC_11734 [Cooperia oncophora]
MKIQISGDYLPYYRMNLRRRPRPYPRMMIRRFPSRPVFARTRVPHIPVSGRHRWHSDDASGFSNARATKNGKATAITDGDADMVVSVTSSTTTAAYNEPVVVIHNGFASESLAPRMNTQKDSDEQK